MPRYNVLTTPFLDPIEPEEECKLTAAKPLNVTVPGCEPKVITVNSCDGGCPSGRYPRMEGTKVTFTQSCKCCRAKATQVVQVTLRCRKSYGLSSCIFQVSQNLCSLCLPLSVSLRLSVSLFPLWIAVQKQYTF